MSNNKLYSIFTGFRPLYNNYVLENKENLKEVWINDVRYQFPLEALKVRFQLEFFWKKIRMTQPGDKSNMSEFIQIVIENDYSVIKFIYNDFKK